GLVPGQLLRGAGKPPEPVKRSLGVRHDLRALDAVLAEGLGAPDRPGRVVVAVAGSHAEAPAGPGRRKPGFRRVHAAGWYRRVAAVGRGLAAGGRRVGY